MWKPAASRSWNSSPEARRDLGKLHLGYPRESIDHLLAFAAKLEIVGQMLPTATATYRKMLADRLHSYFAGLDNACDMPFGIAFLLLVYLYVDTITRCSERNEHHHIIDTGDCIALGGDIDYLYILQQRLGLAFS